MSWLCDSCLRPGACCNDLFLRGGDDDGRFEEPMSAEKAEHLALRYGLPFRPLRQTEEARWRWWCTNLLPSGRCGDYENRPEVCRIFVAGSDPLCVHYWAADEEPGK